jgi:hypothetical protein
VSNNISLDVACKLAEENKVIKQKEDAKNAISLEKQYGVFWYFIVEAFNDNAIGKDLRSKPENIESFINYIKNKYGISWIDNSKYSEDDCVYLFKLRYKKQCKEENKYYQQLDKM